jgi:hypothetical protein
MRGTPVAFQEAMRGSRLLIVLSGLPALILGAAIRLHFYTLPDTISSAFPSAVERHLSTYETGAVRAEADGVTDLYGNEIDTAVATYQIDAGGRIYEMHAPDTAVAKLLPPRM